MHNVIDLSALSTIQPEKPPFKLIKVSELTKQPKPIDWLIDCILEAGSLNLLFGEPEVGKSLIAFDMAYCVASGRYWQGNQTQKRDVVILAGEGHSGIGRRMRAIEVKYSAKTPDNLLVSEIPANLTDREQAQWVADAITQNCTNGGLVIVDTLNRNMGAADENNARDIAELLNILDGYIRSQGLAVLIIHHSGHNNPERARGSSAIRAALDAEFCVTKKSESIKLKCTKAKDFERFKDMEFSLKVTELGDQWHDKSGQPITSVYLEYKGETTNTINPKTMLSGRDSLILQALHDAIEKQGIEPSSEIKSLSAGFETFVGKDSKIVHSDHWRDCATPRIDAKNPGTKERAFNRAKKKFIESKLVATLNNYFWPI